MKKRKKPIFLAAVVVVLVASVMIFNASAFSAASQSPDLNAGTLTPEQQQQKDALAKQQIKQEQEDAARAAKAAATAKPAANSGPLAVAPGGGDSDGVMAHQRGIEALGSGQPKILAPKDIKPKKIDPQDASVNSQAQWYSKESGAGGN